MNREIKFRGKRLDNGEWVYGFLVKRSGMTQIIVAYSQRLIDYDLFVIDPATVGQYTGLNDKDGNEIYDGDVTKHSAHNMTCVIKWIDKFICFAGEDVCAKDHYMFYQNIDESELKIIFNIHDNPELINQ